MKLDINFPLTFRASIKGLRGSKHTQHVSVTHLQTVDVPEVAFNETAVVFDEISMEGQAGARRGSSVPQLRMHEGALYRRVTGRMNETGIELVRHTVVAPVRRRWEWTQSLLGINTSRNLKIWPEINQRTRDETRFGHVAPLLEEIDAQDYAESMARIEAQAGRLLSVGGQMWIRSANPCITVHLGKAEGEVASTELGFLPERIMSETDRIYVPLAAARGSDGLPGVLEQHGLSVDGAPFLDLTDTILQPFDFDEDRENAHHLAVAVASAVVRRHEQHRFHTSHRNQPPLFDGDRLAVFETVRERLLSTCDILDRRNDIGDFLPEIARMWSEVKRPLYDDLLGVRSEDRDLVEKRLERHFDTAAISVLSVPDAAAFAPGR